MKIQTNPEDTIRPPRLTMNGLILHSYERGYQKEYKKTEKTIGAYDPEKHINLPKYTIEFATEYFTNVGIFEKVIRE